MCHRQIQLASYVRIPHYDMIYQLIFALLKTNSNRDSFPLLIVEYVELCDRLPIS